MPTPALASLLSLAVAILAVLAASPLLSWLPVPDDDPESEPAPDLYRRLDSASFRWTVGVAALCSSLILLNLSEPWQWPIWLPYLLGGTLLAVIDLRTTYLPLRLHYFTLAGVAIGVSCSAALCGDWLILLTSLGTAVGAAALFWGVWWFSGDQLGFGDVRLAGLIGAAAGAVSVAAGVQALLLGSLIGALWGGAVWLRHRASPEFPFGPALLLGPVAAAGLSLAIQLA